MFKCGDTVVFEKNYYTIIRLDDEVFVLQDILEEDNVRLATPHEIEFVSHEEKVSNTSIYKEYNTSKKYRKTTSSKNKSIVGNVYETKTANWKVIKANKKVIYIQKIKD